MAKTASRPLLNGSLLRNTVHPSLAEKSQIHTAVMAVDRLGGLYTALEGANKSIDPSETKEARALRYERQYQDAMNSAQKTVDGALEALETLKEEAQVAGLSQAGLSKPPANEVEIRAALRGMDSTKRNKEIKDAFQNGDTDVLASIHGQNPILWGGSKDSLGAKFDLFIAQAAPQAHEGIKSYEKAKQGLEFAAESFVEGARSMRDVAALEVGEKQLKQHQESQAALKAALVG